MFLAQVSSVKPFGIYLVLEQLCTGWGLDRSPSVSSGALKQLKLGLVLCHEAVGFCGFFKSLATTSPVLGDILPLMFWNTTVPGSPAKPSVKDAEPTGYWKSGAQFHRIRPSFRDCHIPDPLVLQSSSPFPGAKPGFWRQFSALHGTP